MRKADLERRCDEFVEEIDEIKGRATLVREAQRVLGKVPDKRWAYEALAVNAVTAWSDFAEDLFLACINRDSSILAARLGLTLPRHLSLALCEALFTTTRGYLDFRGLSDLKDHAKKNLGDSHPFAVVTDATASSLEELARVRNYIVHRSRSSRAQYKAKVLTPRGIKRLIYPGTFLLARTAGRTRLERYLDALGSAGSAIKAAL
jgi:hypothetical protein